MILSLDLDSSGPLLIFHATNVPLAHWGDRHLQGRRRPRSAIFLGFDCPARGRRV